MDVGCGWLNRWFDTLGGYPTTMARHRMGAFPNIRTRFHSLVINTLKLNIMATTFKSNDSAILAIQQMLQTRCEQEPSFALKMMNPQKSMEGCINYYE